VGEREGVSERERERERERRRERERERERERKIHTHSVSKHVSTSPLLHVGQIKLLKCLFTTACTEFSVLIHLHYKNAIGLTFEKKNPTQRKTGARRESKLEITG